MEDAFGRKVKKEKEAGFILLLKKDDNVPIDTMPAVDAVEKLLFTLKTKSHETDSYFAGRR